MAIGSDIAPNTVRGQIMQTAYGVLTDNGWPPLFTSATAPATQTVFGSLLGLRTGDLVTGIKLRNSVAAAGTLPTTARFGIASSAGIMLAISGNLNAVANWPAGACAFPLAAPYTVLADGGYFAVFVVNGVWGTTQPTPVRTTNSASSVADGAFATPTFNWAGQTDLPAVSGALTLTASGSAYYMAFY